ncbi:hypothetical protein BKI52_11495 [marine bacterium AO1-C]|nr:hypothetical protein BKI52_11495 [marine bacterium AO1-C]
MSVSYIPERIKLILWGKAAGRCEYRGCQEVLYRDDTTKVEFNKAYIAHIVADKSTGPRGDKIRSNLLKDKLCNLMLLCDKHHRLIDIVDINGHPEELLLEMKEEHERRMMLITGIKEEMKSHIIIYKANIGKNYPNLTFQYLSKYLLPKHYPANDYALDLSLINSVQRDQKDSYWLNQEENLQEQFDEQIKPLLKKNRINHLSIFAFAPMPLLIKLGVLFNDIVEAEIYQPRRNPKTWRLSESGQSVNYLIQYPSQINNKVALNISLSATINNERIIKVLGSDCSIYTITIEKPFNDFLQNKNSLKEFSERIRLLLDNIKEQYDSETLLNVFPAMPIATAIEFGRVWMPKADMPLVIYEENRNRMGFFKTIKIC